VIDTVSSGGFFAEHADDLAAAMSKGKTVGVMSKVAGKTFSAAGVANKTAEFIDNPSEFTAAQAVWEGEKWVLTAVCAPVGLAFQGLDLTGYGPSTLSIRSRGHPGSNARRRNITARRRRRIARPPAPSTRPRRGSRPCMATPTRG